MNNRRYCGKLVILATALSLCAYADVHFSQTVSLRSGWNAVYLQIAPSGTADEVFSDWPVDFASVYDPAAFQETKQYSGTSSTEGMANGGYRTWHRGDPGASSLLNVPANSVIVCYATNEMAGTVLYGRPSAPRISWHATSTNESLNLVGIASVGTTTPGGYFSGLDVGAATYKRIWGPTRASPSLSTVYANTEVNAGEVILAESSGVSDWSGVLHVSPIAGIDFGTNEVVRTLEVRNDGAAARTVKVALAAGSAANAQDIPPVPTPLSVRDASNADLAARDDWAAFSPSAPFTKELDAGETLTLQIAFDRTQVTAPAGTYFGALLVVTDEDGESGMRVVVPLEADADGGTAAADAWPKGFWLAVAELDTVTYVGAPVPVSNDVAMVDEVYDESTGLTTVVTNYMQEVLDQSFLTEHASGGRMKVRLPLYVAGDGSMELLQRFWYGRDASGALHVYSGAVTNAPVPLVGRRRVSTAFLPVDQPRIPASDGVFGRVASFPFTVGERSRVNPMRHALHPQHDALGFDFATPSPSGDDLENYLGSVKPETFSITNLVEFTWSAQGQSRWTPSQTLSGTLKWEFGGLRHEGMVRASGPFTMKRISSAALER